MSPIMLALGAGILVWVVLVALVVKLGGREATGVASRLDRVGPAEGEERPSGRRPAGGPVLLRRDPVDAGPTQRSGGLLKLLPRAPEGIRTAFLPHLVRAGFHRPDHVNGFFAGSLVCGLVATLATWTGLVPYEVEDVVRFTNMVLALLLGLYLPVLWLRKRIRTRQHEIRDTLPDALDLMSICIQAGLGVEAAMVRVGEELQRRGQPLGDEFVLTSLQIDAGRPRGTALHALALRCDLQEVRNFVMLLSQTERLGTGVVEALRTAADTVRTRRMQQAEAAAAKTSVKTMFPVVLCMLPATLVVLAGPALLQLIRSFDALSGL